MDGDKESLKAIYMQLQQTHNLIKWVYYLVGAGLFLLLALLIK
jgi:hypothetical protein